MAEIHQLVNERYSKAAGEYESMPCCPGTTYPKQFLEVIPPEILERDYGCGNPTPWIAEGDTVLDLGSGGGKMCFVAAQIVGERGRVIGVDMNDEMLALARKAAPAVAAKLGHANVEFRKGYIEDLALNVELIDAFLRDSPIRTSNDLTAFEEMLENARAESPLIAPDSIDVALSNCVLNLVADERKRRLFKEIFRVLKRGGRAVISDVVSDEAVPEALRRDATLWSGCVSGAMLESELLEAFEAAGFHGIELLSRAEDPYLEIEGIEFRTVTVSAWKGKQGACFEHNQAVIYKGPYKQVLDDDGHVFERGKRIAVCGKTFELLGRAPYEGHFERIEPRVRVAKEAAAPFSCGDAPVLRDPRVQKNGQSKEDGSAAPVRTNVRKGGCC